MQFFYSQLKEEHTSAPNIFLTSRVGPLPFLWLTDPLTEDLTDADTVDV